MTRYTKPPSPTRRTFGLLMALLLVASLLPLIVVTNESVAASPDPGWLSDWTKRIELTVDHNDIDATLSHFPVLVYLSSSSGTGNTDVTCIFDEVGANSKKIAVTKSDGTTQLYVEIEKWDSGNETAWLWVSRSGWSISSTVDTIIYLYYDSSQPNNTTYVGDPSDAVVHNVWDASHKLVTHMRDDPDTSHVRDSTVNANDGTKGAAGEPTVTAGQIDDAQDFDGNDYIIIGDMGRPTYYTVEHWITRSGANALIERCTVFNRSKDWSEWGIVALAGVIKAYTTNGVNAAQLAASTIDTTDIPLDTLKHVVVTVDGSNFKFYLDGVLHDTVPQTVQMAGTGNYVSIGRYGNLSQVLWIGKIDEARVSYVARSTAWVKASYESGRDDLIAFGSEEIYVVVPTVTTQGATNIEVTTATGNGNITDTGGEVCDERGVEWGTSSGNYPNSHTDTDGFDTGAFTKGMTGLPSGTTIYYRAKAHNSAGWGYGGEQTFLTKPAAPTDVQATDGIHTDKVVITWTKSTSATEYQVYRDGVPLGWLGDVATHDDTGADAPTITGGTASASDGTYAAHVALSIAGEGVDNGTTHTYKVRAKNATGESADSGTNTGYRGHGDLTYQWQRSDADSDADYSDIDGATIASYDDTGAPENGDGRYYKCRLNATGAIQQFSTSDRGYRLPPPTKPELIKPIENQPRFGWTTAEGADNYRLLVDNDVDFSSPAEDRTLTDNYYQIPPENSLDNGVYWWKVIAINPAGETSSDVWGFVVGTVGEVDAEPPIDFDLVAAAMFLFPIVLMIIALAFDNVVFASFAGIVFVFSGIYFIDTIWLMMIFIGLGIYLLVTALMSEED